MRCAIILSVILGSSIAASPALGQVSVAPDSSLASQSASADATPPPFPPMPRARPSHRCVNTCGGQAKSTHHRTAVHHSVKSRHSEKSTHRHASSASSQRGKARKDSHKKKAAAHEPVLHLSAAAIRRCHKESYGQLMSDSKCRALMSQELKAKEAHHRTARHKSSSKHEKKKVSHTSSHRSKHR